MFSEISLNVCSGFRISSTCVILPDSIASITYDVIALLSSLVTSERTPSPDVTCTRYVSFVLNGSSRRDNIGHCEGDSVSTLFETIAFGDTTYFILSLSAT
jgi:hypothetical protein